MIKFEIDPFRKHYLLNGLDNIGLTLEKGSAYPSLRGGNQTPSSGPGSKVRDRHFRDLPHTGEAKSGRRRLPQGP